MATISKHNGTWRFFASWIDKDGTRRSIIKQGFKHKYDAKAAVSMFELCPKGENHGNN